MRLVKDSLLGQLSVFSDLQGEVHELPSDRRAEFDVLAMFGIGFVGLNDIVKNFVFSHLFSVFESSETRQFLNSTVDERRDSSSPHPFSIHRFDEVLATSDLQLLLVGDAILSENVFLVSGLQQFHGETSFELRLTKKMTDQCFFAFGILNDEGLREKEISLIDLLRWIREREVDRREPCDGVSLVHVEREYLLADVDESRECTDRLDRREASSGRRPARAKDRRSLLVRTETTIPYRTD